jgi:hypothetical protein
MKIAENLRSSAFYILLTDFVPLLVKSILLDSHCKNNIEAGKKSLPTISDNPVDYSVDFFVCTEHLLLLLVSLV